MAFQKGQSGNPSGKPVGTRNKKKVIKVADFVADNDINIPKMWLEAIMQIIEPEAKAKALSEYNKWVAAMPKESSDEVEEQPINSADVLSIIGG
jgi:hypothetical protein